MAKNQIDHRADYRKQKAAGQIAEPASRHGRSRHRVVRPGKHVRKPPARRGPTPTLAEQLGIVVSPDVQQRIAAADAKAAKAEPLAALMPPTAANVSAVATPEVVVDSPQAEGELPPVAEIERERLELPPPPDQWPARPLDRSVETNRPVAEVDAEEAEDEEAL